MLLSAEDIIFLLRLFANEDIRKQFPIVDFNTINNHFDLYLQALLSGSPFRKELCGDFVKELTPLLALKLPNESFKTVSTLLKDLDVPLTIVNQRQKNIILNAFAMNFELMGNEAFYKNSYDEALGQYSNAVDAWTRQIDPDLAHYFSLLARFQYKVALAYKKCDFLPFAQIEFENALKSAQDPRNLDQEKHYLITCIKQEIEELNTKLPKEKPAPVAEVKNGTSTQQAIKALLEENPFLPSIPPPKYQDASPPPTPRKSPQSLAAFSMLRTQKAVNVWVDGERAALKEGFAAGAAKMAAAQVSKKS